MTTTKLERFLRSTSGTEIARYPLGIPTPVADSVRQRSAFPSNAARRLLKELEMLARNPNLPVLLEGETGTGKTLAARAIHDLSTRRGGPFRRVDLGTTRRDFAASELFGHMPGAFTGATTERVGDFPRAHRGSIALDEIGKCDLDVQQQLLGASEYGHFRPMGSERWFTVDVRVVAATNVNLSEQAAKGLFLPDLFARIEAGRIVLPPLRARRDDIPTLLADAISGSCRRMGRATPPSISDELLAAALEYDWPANLRELVMTFDRIVTEAGTSPVLLTSHVSSYLAFGRRLKGKRRRVPPSEVVRIHALVGGSVEKTVALAHVSRATVFRHVRAARERGHKDA